MAKAKTVYVCSNCGYESARWNGRCPSCGEWNTFTEETVVRQSPSRAVTGGERQVPRRLGEIGYDEQGRIAMHDTEFDRVLGGGLVRGSLVLIGGEPGIGKSTLALQTALRMRGGTVLYVSAEESASQIKMRANRLGADGGDCLVLCETSLENILDQARAVSPVLVVIDSIQTIMAEGIESSPGTVSQVRECATRILKFAKETDIPFIIIGHINKDGNIAGPKVLEHIVDTVLQFEGDQHYFYRILRSVKNRFGSTFEIGIYEMKQDGLQCVDNPSRLLLSDDVPPSSGISVAAMMEGARPFLVETQALVSSAVYGTPQRSATGFDLRRMNMLLAVLEKRAGFKLAQKDVFLNIATV